MLINQSLTDSFISLSSYISLKLHYLTFYEEIKRNGKDFV
jgi:hypothetical protein